ncbi:hypothetical protein K488DRAFT_87225 [Vararia minispora EC-137]|uniref:Uncharacterized protein n=1 Tax=Vararia minispora EC-137 TaxID=1314806 RepID=A0ACB8QH62_9AGAM|nr:hypothetical protein K488DRAFT_87225 [Vararia minispora EC-137]
MSSPGPTVATPQPLSSSPPPANESSSPPAQNHYNPLREPGELEPKLQITEHKMCTLCRKPNEKPAYRLCPACRAKNREYSRKAKERKREKMKQIAEEERAPREGGSSASAHIGMVPSAVPSAGQKKRKRSRDPSPAGGEQSHKKRPSAPLAPPPVASVDPDEYQFASDAIAALADVRRRTPMRLNFRFTYAVVASDDVPHQKRLTQVVSSLRDKAGLTFSLQAKLLDPGSSSYARHNAITERYRCRCMRSSASSSSAGKTSPLKRKQSDISSWLGNGQNVPSDQQVKDDKCGGMVYVSSEWDTRSHPGGIKGQRIVVCVVHTDRDATKAPA